MASTRRQVLLTALSSLIATFSTVLSAAQRTQKASEGPFYPRPSMRPEDTDNDLVKVADKVSRAGGDIISLTGVVSDRSGTALSGLRVEIWQCDVNGRYLHTGDRQTVPYDIGFQGFGHDITDAEGRYRFRTIMPVAYPGRTPHIHVRILDDKRERLTTQLYLKGHSFNARDNLYQRLSEGAAMAVTMHFDNSGTIATVNIVV